MTIGLDIRILKKDIVSDPRLAKKYTIVSDTSLLKHYAIGFDNQIEYQFDYQFEYYRNFNAFLNWVDINVASVVPCKEVIITRKHLETLKTTLKSLTNENCHQLFPTLTRANCHKLLPGLTQEKCPESSLTLSGYGYFLGYIEYDDDYWNDVTELLSLVDALLIETTFESEYIAFYASF